MDMCRVDNADALLPTKSECRGEFWHHCVRLRRLQLRAFGGKVVLHVDDDHDCRPWVDVVYAVGHRKTSHLMAPHSAFASCERGVKPIREGHVLARIGDEDFSFELMVRHVRHPLPWRSLWLTRLQCHKAKIAVTRQAFNAFG